MPYEGQAAVLNEAGRDVEVEDITLDDPGPGEVLVRLAASGVCHTDLTVKNLGGNGGSGAHRSGRRGCHRPGDRRSGRDRLSCPL
jgi:hypothetical protein